MEVKGLGVVRGGLVVTTNGCTKDQRCCVIEFEFADGVVQPHPKLTDLTYCQVIECKVKDIWIPASQRLC